MKTLSHVSESVERHEARTSAQLYLSLPHRPCDPTARCGLGAIDEVAVGRGDVRSIRRAGKRLAIELADPWLSTAHGRFVKTLGRWTLEDAGSKNGCRLNGERVERQVLVDGDVVELGHTFFVFRDAVPRVAEQLEDLDMASTVAVATGLQTLLPGFAHELVQLARVARSTVSVVLHGPSGTGKEVIARAVHALSDRRGDFVAVNCGALQESLATAELFGHRKGAFSGAVEDRPGLVRAAEGGTLFLDEIGDLPLPSQAALLRVLQEREVVPVGGTRPVPVDLRVVCATHRDLDALVEAETFRQDLHTRLAGFRLTLPALAERREDVGLVIAGILRRLAGERADRVVIDPKAVRCLFRYEWPGNIRELEKSLGAALVLAGDGPIQLEHLPSELRTSTSADDSSPQDGARRDELVALLGTHRGNISAVARALGKAPVQIRRWLRRYGLDPDRFR